MGLWVNRALVLRRDVPVAHCAVPLRVGAAPVRGQLVTSAKGSLRRGEAHGARQLDRDVEVSFARMVALLEDNHFENSCL